MTLGTRLNQARNYRGLSLEKAADMLIHTTDDICSWESGKSIPDLEIIPEIAAL